ncbi:KLLA0F01254p [Mycolicibacterium novocastrense]|uniref:KLLA0F01254p n=1 Tax=Mycolicibacterium novocastrense TaxID=59813 RepID=A0ABQ0KR99_MYCNV|nr:KLLA0F01254p [Mycolicibacterium novocastrense]
MRMRRIIARRTDESRVQERNGSLPIRPSEMGRPPSRVFLADKTEGLGGRVTAGNSPARAGAKSLSSIPWRC